MRRIILATHGELSTGMLKSVKMIVGDLADDIKTYSLYPGESPSDYAKELEEEIQSQEDMEFILITDIKGGSVHTALMQLVKYPNVRLFSGMNMNLVLDVIFCTQDIDREKNDELLDNAREGITSVSFNDVKRTIAEDF